MTEGLGSQWAFIFATKSLNDSSVSGVGNTKLRSSRNVEGPQLLSSIARYFASSEMPLASK